MKKLLCAILLSIGTFMLAACAHDQMPADDNSAISADDETWQSMTSGYNRDFQPKKVQSKPQQKSP